MSVHTRLAAPLHARLALRTEFVPQRPWAQQRQGTLRMAVLDDGGPMFLVHLATLVLLTQPQSS